MRHYRNAIDEWRQTPGMELQQKRAEALCSHPFDESATVPPILLHAAISLRALRGPLLAWRVLPAVTVAAAM
ncbi:hypothetical protein [Roseiflexus sp.]